MLKLKRVQFCLLTVYITGFSNDNVLASSWSKKPTFVFPTIYFWYLTPDCLLGLRLLFGLSCHQRQLSQLSDSLSRAELFIFFVVAAQIA